MTKVDTSGFRTMFEQGLLETAPPGLAEDIRKEKEAKVVAIRRGVVPLWMNMEIPLTEPPKPHITHT